MKVFEKNIFLELLFNSPLHFTALKLLIINVTCNIKVSTKNIFNFFVNAPTEKC